MLLPGTLAYRTQQRGKRGQRKAILADAAGIHEEVTRRVEAELRLRAWVETWRVEEPDAVRIFCTDIEGTVLYLNLPPRLWLRARTTNPIERLQTEMERMSGCVCLAAS